MTIAGTEVRMRVVVEGAPSNTTGILRIGRELIVDAGMAQRVLALAFVVVGGFGGISVTHEFSIQILGMVGLLEREAEIVHGEDVFKELGRLEVTDAAGLTRRVQRRARARWYGCRSCGRRVIR